MTAAKTISPIGSGSCPRRASSRCAMICPTTNAMSTANPKPVSWSGPTSYESGWWTIEAKILCIGLNLGGDETRDRAGRVGVEVEPGSLALLESEESCAGDHRCVVGGKAWAGSEYANTLPLESGSHRT